MKSIFRNIMIALVGLSACGCTLIEEPSSFVGSTDYYQNRQQCIAGLNACYIPLKDIYNYTFLIAVEGVTDLMHIRSGTLDAQLDISPAQPRLGSTIWKQGYKGVMYSNAVLAGIERAPLTDEEKAPLYAEGVVMRAYYYWLLTSFFGDVPFYTKDVANEAIRIEIAGLGRMPAVDTRNYLIEELEKWVPELDQIRSSEITDNRCGAAMGWMLMAKLAMWNQRWEDALRALKHLEEIYGSLSQYPLSDIPWRVKNTPESIFEIQRTYTEGGLSVVSNCAAICTPHPRSSANDGYTYSGIVVEELGNTATTWTPLRPNPYYYSSLMPRNGKDKRTALNLAWEYNGRVFNDTATMPFLGPKFWCPNMKNLADYNNQSVFRYADAILMMSECYCEIEGKENESISYLNQVKERAGINLYGAYRNKEHLTEEIRKERGRELLGEFQRKFDLVRWGIWYRATYDNTAYETVQKNMRSCHEYYPIPDTEVALSGGALDNNAYAADGL